MAKEVWLSAKNVAEMIGITEGEFMCAFRNNLVIEGVSLPHSVKTLSGGKEHYRFPYSDVITFVNKIKEARKP